MAGDGIEGSLDVHRWWLSDGVGVEPPGSEIIPRDLELHVHLQAIILIWIQSYPFGSTRYLVRFALETKEDSKLASIVYIRPWWRG